MIKVDPDVRVKELPDGRRIFYIPVNNIPPGGADRFIEKLKEQFRKRKNGRRFKVEILD